MPRTAALVLVVLLAPGCWSWSWGGEPPGGRTVWTPSPERPEFVLEPTHPMEVWIGVPPAVWLTGPAPAGSWPEYPPLSKPWETAIWVDEHWDWDWNGVAGWMWLRGRWIDPPGEGFEWNPPTWVHDEHGTYFMAGFFCAAPDARDCPSCQTRREARRSHVACRPGLDDEVKRTLARNAAPPPGTFVALQ